MEFRHLRYFLALGAPQNTGLSPHSGLHSLRPRQSSTAAAPLLQRCGLLHI